MSATLTILAALCLCVLFSAYHVSATRRRKPFPPGPPPKPLVGNLRDIPNDGHEWEAYERLGRKYGSDVVYLSSLGTRLLVVNSFQAARELLDKRGALYSSRPRFVMICELMEWNWNMALMPYDKTYQAYRRTVQQEFQPSLVAETYRPVIMAEVNALLRRLFTTPENFREHIKQTVGAIIMMITYGHQVTSMDDKFIRMAELVREYAEKTPGNSAVDIFPILKYLPTWFPGAGFHKHARIGRELSAGMRRGPFEAVKKQMTAGTARASLVTRLLQSDAQPDGMDKDEFVMNSAGVVYSAGADTSVSALINFVLAMTLYADVQTRAQEELDRVVGRDRLPTLADRGELPYVSNLVKETLRWMPVSTLGIPHATSEADEYRGWYIPKGTIVLANIYAMLHDESVYKNPREFNPDRFSPSEENPIGEQDPARVAFGFGRRICPGRFFADDVVWLAIASMLHALRISKPAPAAGADDVEIRWCSGLVSVPSEFSFKIEPRFAGAQDLVTSGGGDSAS
ncbi:cytochrome P450 [Cerioporus squamosus]|nr:cytochrome P450 [Cerioporus squamosus]